MPFGVLKAAAVPTPSPKAPAPLPANVVTSPAHPDKRHINITNRKSLIGRQVKLKCNKRYLKWKPFESYGLICHPQKYHQKVPEKGPSLN